MKRQSLVILYGALLLGCAASRADMAGTITNETGNAIAGARVFAEPGIENAVVQGVVTGMSFSIAGDFFGGVGVFATAPGYGFGGVHLNVAAGDEPCDVVITLTKEAAISGTVNDARGAPVSGAHVASIAITHPVKVGIPLSKMAAYGIAPPESDASGRFRVGNVPADAVIALKFAHPLFAQEAVTDIAAGTSDLKVVMHRGVTVRGQVSVRGAADPVSGAVVTARNAQPPHDTAFGTSDGSGMFTMRLKPGVYLFQAYASGRISPGLQRVDIHGESPERQVRLALSETSVITGVMGDAKTGEPIPGVRVLLETQGRPAGAARTGGDGRFRLQAAEGDNLLLFHSAPGYLPPDTRALRVNAPGGGTLELPGLWLAPIPEFNLRVYEDDGETPVAGAFISLLRPKQFGWQQTDADGRVILRFTNMPDDNRIFGIAEHPGKAQGALFALDRGNAEDGSVALLSLATVTGRVVNERGKAVAGATVGALFADDALPDALPLWRCLTDADGAFFWPAVPAGVPQRCLASLGAINAAAGQDINPAPAETVDIGVITLSGAATKEDAAALKWRDVPHLCGPDADIADSALLAFYCSPAEAPVYIKAVENIRAQLRVFHVESLVAVTGAYTCDAAAVPVYAGGAAPHASCVYDRNGEPLLRAVGLPPITLLRTLPGEL